MVTPGSERALAVARTINALAAADPLPGASDFEATQRPAGRSWVRRIGGRNIWLWYRFNAVEVILLTLTTEPPGPVDDAPQQA
jgi:hypothetical protein